LGITERNVVINGDIGEREPLRKELDVYDWCEIKSFIENIVASIGELLEKFDCKFVDDKELFEKELLEYGKVEGVGEVYEKNVRLLYHTFELIEGLHNYIYRNNELNLIGEIEKLITIMYNKNVMKKDYMAEFFFKLAQNEASLDYFECAIGKMEKAIELHGGGADNRALVYFNMLFDLYMKVESKERYFHRAFEGFKEVFVQVGNQAKNNTELKQCLEKVFDILVENQDVRKIDDLIIVLRDILDKCDESENTGFYLYHIYEELLQKQSYFKVMQCKIVGEGAQAKALLIKKLRQDDVGIAKVIAEHLGVTEKTASNYLNRSKLPFNSFRSFMEATFGCDYSELVVLPEDQIRECLELIVSDIELYMDEVGFKKTEYLLKKSRELKFEYNEAFALICNAVIRFSLRDDSCWDVINEAVFKSKKVCIQLHTLALAKKGYMLNYSGKSMKTLKLLEGHRKKIELVYVAEEYRGQLYYHLSDACRMNSKLRSATKYVNLACECATTPKIKARRMINLGMILRSQGKPFEAIDCYKSIFKITANRVEHAMLYNNIAYVYIKLKKFDEAYRNIDRAISLVGNVKLLNQKFNYYDTLFEIIMLSDDKQGRFEESFAVIEEDMLKLHFVFQNFKVVSQCIGNIIKIVVKYKKEEYVGLIIKMLKKSCHFYSDFETRNEIKVMLADAVIVFEENEMLRR